MSRPDYDRSGNYTRGPHSVFKGFKEFILKGNVVELATAVIIGAAFTAIVKAFTDGIIQPLINAIPIGADRAQGLGFRVISDQPNTFVDLGTLITTAINFLIVAAVVYFIIVLPYNKLSALAGYGQEVELEAREVQLLTEIRNILDPDAQAKDDAAAAEQARADEVAANPPAAPQFHTGPQNFESGPLARPPFPPPGPGAPAGPGGQGFAPRPDGPSIQPSRDWGGPPSGAIPIQTQRINTGPSVSPSQPPQGPPPAAPPGGGYAPPNPAPGPGQGNYPPPSNYPPRGQGNNPPPNFPPSGGFPAQGGDSDSPGRHSR